MFPESAEVTCQQPLCGARSGLPRQLRLTAQRGQSSGRSPGQRQPDAHLQECRNHQRLNQPQPSTSLTLLLLFTLSLYHSCLLLRVTYNQHRWTFKRKLSEKGVPPNEIIQTRYYFGQYKNNTYHTEQRPDGAVVNITKREMILRPSVVLL